MNKEVIPFGPCTHTDGDVTATVEPHHPGQGHTFQLSTDTFAFMVFPISPYTDELSGVNRAHLDMQTWLKDRPDGIDGVLGHFPCPSRHL